MPVSLPQCLMLTLPGLRLPSETNLREHWATRHRRARAHRTMVFYSLLEGVPRHLATLRPLTITITRIAPRMYDAGDNLPSSCKHLQDGIADWLVGAYGHGQDRLPDVRWQYAQRRGGVREYAVEITLQPGLPDGAATC